MKFAIFSGIAIGFLFFIMIASYALGFWWGSVLVERREPNSVSVSGFYSTGDVLVIFFSVLMAGFNISQLTPAVQKITEGRGAAARIYQTLDRKPLISNARNAIKPEKIDGIIRFENVSFTYPKDKSRQIFKNLNI